MSISDVLGLVINISSLMIGIIGFVYGLFEKKKRHSIQWGDLEVAVKTMILQMKREFVPDILYAPTQKSGIIVELTLPYLQHYTPTFFGIGIAKRNFSYENAYPKILNAEVYFHFETTKWHAYVPKSIMAYNDKKILIVDDFAMSGEYLEKLKKCLIDDAGFDFSKIKTLCLATTEVAINDKKAPDYSWKVSDSAVIYLPWGRPQ